MIKKILVFLLIAMMTFSMNMGVTAADNEFQNNLQRSGNMQYTVSEAQRPDAKVSETAATEQKPVVQEQVPAVQEQEPIVQEQKPAAEEQENTRVIDPDKPMIALTFDDGPSRYTPEILKALKENNSLATFFVLGSEVNKFKDTLNQMIEDGNEVGNHTYNHKDLTKVSDDELYKQIQGTDDLVYIASGYTPTVMRPPYGASNEELNKKISKPIIKWSIDTRDWENRNTQMILDNIFDNVKDGDIILMHDLYGTTAEAAKIAIPKLIEMGYQLVTIDELSEYRGVSLIAGQQYYNMYK
jgi:peptidoglycan/xylan/chitin deacetylase (PgdA/CDA1 family)